jgi:hypothetical protein
MPIHITTSGSFNNTERFLGKIVKGDIFRNLEPLAQRGVAALAANTPQDTGVTAASWGYRIEVDLTGARITWFNTHVIEGVPIAIILEYGHGTGTGGYVQGRDYINPAIKPIFDDIANHVWQEVTLA